MSLPSQPSAADVARRAGVSRTQVSYVLNNRKIEHVSEENRTRILEAARELGYRPQSAAQALARGYANEFALFFPAPYPGRIHAMLGTIHELGFVGRCLPVQYSFHSYRTPARKSEAFQDLLARKPLGIFCSLFDVTEADLEEAVQRGVRHLVLLDIVAHPRFPTLVMPSEDVGFLAATHLLDRGHRRIGFLRPSDPVQARACLRRWEGAQRAVSLVTGAELLPLDWPADELRPSLPAARRFLETFRPRDRNITGLYAYSDDYALPLVAGLLDEGIRVPEGWAVVGTDDLPLAALMRPALTTLRLDRDLLGQQAVDLINRVLSGDSVTPETPRVSVPELVVRQTT